MHRVEKVRKERLYVVGILLGALLLLWASIAMGLSIIPFKEGVWEIYWATILIIGPWYMIAVEEYRAAHMVTRKSHI